MPTPDHPHSNSGSLHISAKLRAILPQASRHRSHHSVPDPALPRPPPNATAAQRTASGAPRRLCVTETRGDGGPHVLLAGRDRGARVAGGGCCDVRLLDSGVLVAWGRSEEVAGSTVVAAHALEMTRRKQAVWGEARAEECCLPASTCCAVLCHLADALREEGTMPCAQPSMARAWKSIGGL